MEAEEKQASIGPSRRSDWMRYGVALVCLGLATLVQLTIQSVSPYNFPFSIYYLAVTVVAWFGGIWPALGVMFLGGFVAQYFFISPPGQLFPWPIHAEDLVRVSLYFIASFAVIGIISRLHKAQEKAELSAADACNKQRALEQEMAERAVRQEHDRQLYEVMQAVNRAEALPAVFDAAVIAICKALNLERSSVLFYDDDGVMRFKAWRGLSDAYRKAVEGHTPWRREELDPQPICIPNVSEAKLEEHLRGVLDREGIRSAAFIPLTYERRLIGKFMLYYPEPHVYSAEEIRLTQSIASQVAFAAMRQKNEEALRRSEEQLRAFFNTGAAGTAQLQLTGKFASVNDRFCQMTGYSREELLQMSSFELSPPEDRAGVLGRFSEFVNGATSAYLVEKPIVRKDGKIIWTQAAVGMIHDSQGKPASAAIVLLDITEPRKAEEMLRESEARLRLAADTAELGLYERDLITNEVVLNAKCRKIMGLPAEGPLDPGVAKASVHPDDRKLVLPLAARAFDPELREVCGADFRIVTPEGKVNWVSGRGRVIFDDSTKPPRALRFLGVLQDITERKELELEIQRSRAALQSYAQKLEERVEERTAHLQQTINSLEGVLYHVAHDLRAPLRAMHNFSLLLLRDHADKLDATGADFARRIAASSAWMDVLIRDLLVYGRMGHQTVNWSEVDLDGLFERLLNELGPEILQAHAEIDLQRPLPRVWGDSKILEQVIRNLLSNAMKFTVPNTPARIRVWGELGNGAVSLSIRDHGIGIASEYHERIFGIFERLHENEEYPGTGIGLAIVKKGVELMGGAVKVESEVGQGSRFVVKLKSTA